MVNKYEPAINKATECMLSIVPNTGEGRLIVAIIEQAIRDYYFGKGRDKANAEMYFKHRVHRHCDLVGLDAGYVRRLLRKVGLYGVARGGI